MFKLYKSYLRKLTLIRALNLLKIYIGYSLSKLTKKSKVYGLPWGISIEPTHLCNLKCPECPTGMGEIQRGKKEFPIKEYIQIIDQVYKSSQVIQLFLQGEPFLNKSIDEFIAYANSKNLYTSISTNGHYLDEEMAHKIVLSGLDKLIISIDGIDQETYEKYRINGKLDRVLNGIDLINKAKQAYHSVYPFLELQFIVFKHNEHQIELFKKMFFKRADKISIKTAQIYDVENKQFLLPTLDKYSRYSNENNSFKQKRKIKNRCFKIWYTSDITTDGDVLPCCYDKFAQYKLGNAFESDFKSIWHGNLAKAYRNKILKTQKDIGICNNCEM